MPKASEIADQIIALINSRPQSPTKAEIEAIINQGSANSFNLGGRDIDQLVLEIKERMQRLMREAEERREVERMFALGARQWTGNRSI